jgi:coatomer protein complex subunit alpha (xenin)
LFFDEKSGALVSNSEDKTLRVWNYETKAVLETQKRESDRYWMLRATKNGSLLAAGHDTGL